VTACSFIPSPRLGIPSQPTYEGLHRVSQLSRMSPSKQNSLKQTDKAITRPKSMGTNASQPSHGSHAECFSNVNGRQAHWSAAPYLYERGVWIGYLAPSSHKHSYRGLPSLNELRSNFSSFATPFPETIQGKPNEERLAVCRGCLGDDSTVFAISELKFVKPKVSLIDTV